MPPLPKVKARKARAKVVKVPEPEKVYASSSATPANARSRTVPTSTSAVLAESLRAARAPVEAAKAANRRAVRLMRHRPREAEAIEPAPFTKEESVSSVTSVPTATQPRLLMPKPRRSLRLKVKLRPSRPPLLPLSR